MFVPATGIELLGIGLAKQVWWDGIFVLAYPFLVGILVSFFFYWLVVWLPERTKRTNLKDDFKEYYRDLKEDIAVQIIFASQRGGREDLKVTRLPRLVSPPSAQCRM